MTVEYVSTDLRLALGESPSWDPVRQRLDLVDIVGGVVYALDVTTGHADAVPLDPPVGAVVPRSRGRGRVVALADRLVTLSDDGVVTTLAEIEPGVAATRLNDARCDSRGRLLVGTFAGPDDPGLGSLYRVDPDSSVHRLVAGTTMSNGIGWSPDGEWLYFADSATGVVSAFPYDPGTGAVGAAAPFTTFATGEGAPDGLTVDVDGGVWVASFGGGFVRRITAQGTVDRTVRLPCPNVTSCAFGGPDLDELFITTARIGMTPRQLIEHPDAGAVFRLRPGVRGTAAAPFAG